MESDSEGPSRSIVSSLSSRNNCGLEVDATIAFLRLIVRTFPSSQLTRPLLHSLSEKRGNTTRLCREFREKNWTCFRAVVEHTLIPGVSATASADSPSAVGSIHPQILFSENEDYASKDYTTVEVDCIVKLPFAPGSAIAWTQDPAHPVDVLVLDAAGGSPLLSRMAPLTTSPLPVDAVPTSYPASAVFDAAVSVASGNVTGVDSDSTRSSVHYPSGATHYIVGEVYCPHGPGRSGAVQKLLQVERILGFLVIKEGKRFAVDCIAGMVFMGPHLNKSMRQLIVDVLTQNQDVLPWLWQLYAYKRVFAFKTPDFSVGVLSGFHHELALEDMSDSLQRLEVSTCAAFTMQSDHLQRMETVASEQSDHMKRMESVVSDRMQCMETVASEQSDRMKRMESVVSEQSDRIKRMESVVSEPSDRMKRMESVVCEQSDRMKRMEAALIKIVASLSPA
jgi:uncharacterized coiled-coil protein SlyX